MADNIGINLKLDGESSFKRGVKSANEELKNMNAQMKLMEAESKAQGKSLRDMAGYQEAFNKQLEAARNKINAYSEGLKHAKDDQQRLGKELSELKDRYAEAQKTLDAMTKSGNASEAELKEQQAEVNKLEKAVDSGNRTFQAAGDRVNKWEKDLANAKREEIELRSSTDDVTESTDRMVDSIGGLEAFKAMSDVLSKAGDAFKKLATAAYDAAIELDKGYDIIITKTGATGDALEAMQGTADSLYSSMNASTTDIGSAIGQVNTRFRLTGRELENVSEKFLKFAKINGTDVSNSVDLADRILTQYGQDASEVGDLLDMVTKKSQETGIETSRYLNALDQSAGTFRIFGMNMSESIQLIGELEDNGIDASTALQGMKRAASQYAKEGKSMRQGLKDTIASIKNARTETEAWTLAQEIFGARGFTNMAAAIRDGRFSIDELSETMQDYAGTVENTYEATLDPWDQMAVAMQNLKAAGGDLAGEFLKTLAPALETLTDLLKGFREWFSGLPDEAKTFIGSLVGVGAALGTVGSKFGGLISSFAQLKMGAGIISQLKAMQGIAPAAGSGIAGLGSAAAAAAPFIGLLVGGIVAAVAVSKAWTEAIKEQAKEVYELSQETQTARKEYNEVEDEFDKLKSGAYDYMTASERAAMAQDLLAKAQKASTTAAKGQNKALSHSNELLYDAREAAKYGWGSGMELLTEAGYKNAALNQSLQDTNEILETSDETIQGLTTAVQMYNVEAAELNGASAVARDQFLAMQSTLDSSSEAYQRNAEVMDALVTHHQEASSTIQARIDEIKTQMASLEAEYAASEQRFSQTFSSMFTMWDMAPQIQAADLQQIVDNLQSQTQYFETYYGNMRKAIENGYSEVFVNSLNDGSEKSAKILAAMAADTEGAYQETINAEFEAQQQSIAQLSQYSAEVETNFSERHKALQKDLKESINAMNMENQAFYASVQTINGAINGLDSQAPRLIAKYGALADQVVAEYKRRLDIESPSKVFKELGEYTVQGAIVGTDDMASELSRAYSDLAQVPIDAYSNGIDVSMPDLSAINTSPSVVNEVRVYLGDRELTEELTDGVIRQINSLQRQAYAGR